MRYFRLEPLLQHCYKAYWSYKKIYKQDGGAVYEKNKQTLLLMGEHLLSYLDSFEGLWAALAKKYNLIVIDLGDNTSLEGNRPLDSNTPLADKTVREKLFAYTCSFIEPFVAHGYKSAAKRRRLLWRAVIRRLSYDYQAKLMITDAHGASQLPLACYKNMNIIPFFKGNADAKIICPLSMRQLMSCFWFFIENTAAYAEFCQRYEITLPRNIAVLEEMGKGQKSSKKTQALAKLIENIFEAIDKEKVEITSLQHCPEFDLCFWRPKTRYRKTLPYKKAKAYIRSWKSSLGAKRPCLGFHPGIYMEQCSAYDQSYDPFLYYLRTGKKAGPWTIKVLQQCKSLSIGAKEQAVALHIHAYYIDMLPDIIKSLLKNEKHPDLYISVCDAIALEQAKQLLSVYRGKTVVKIFPNAGRDIGPFLTGFGKELVQGYEIIGHIHTKKSPHLRRKSSSKAWHAFLIRNLVFTKGKKVLDSIIQHFYENPNLGLIFPDHPLAISWNKNYQYGLALAKRLGLKQPLPLFINFPGGNMFWIRRAALEKLVAANFQWEDYPIEPIPADGTMLHALERIVPLFVEKQGLTCQSCYFDY